MTMDGAFGFLGEYAEFQYAFNMYYLTETDRLSNDWPIGSGLIWLPFFLAVHAIAKGLEFLNWGGDFWAAHGFSQSYRLGVALGVQFLAIVGLLAGIFVSKKRFGAGSAMWGAVLAIAGTPFGFYFYYYALMSHITSFALVSVFLALWMARAGSVRRAHEWALLGILAGLMAMTRPQTVLTLIAPAVEAIAGGALSLNRRRRSEYWRTNIRGIGLFALGAAAAFLPQCVFWNCIYGHPLQLPKMEEMRWVQPQILPMLFSDYHGLVSWCPLTVLAIPGLWLIYKKERVIGLALGLILLAQVYVNAANEIWWAGGSFSNRRFVDYSLIFLLAFAACCGRWGRSPLFVLLVALSASWSFLLMGAERAQVLTLNRYVPWNAEFFQSLLNLAGDPLRLVLSLKGDFAGAAVWLRVAGAGLIVAAGFGVYVLLSGKTPDRTRQIYRLAAGAAACFVIVLNSWVAVAAIRTPTLDLEQLKELGIFSTTFAGKGAQTFSRTNRLLWNNYYEAGFYYMTKEKYPESIHFLQKASALMPEHPLPYRYIGTAQMKDGDFTQAYGNLEKALEIDPGYGAARQALLECCEHLVGQECRDARIYIRLARLHIEDGRMDDAERVLNEILAFDPSNAEARALLD
jgi:tetratricopeptide (TPR) repeat protein